MKKVTKLFIFVLFAIICNYVKAQTTYAWKKMPNPDDVVIDVIKKEKRIDLVRYSSSGEVEDLGKKLPSDEDLYQILLVYAREKYGQTYPKHVLRNFKSSYRDSHKEPHSYYYGYDTREYTFSASVVLVDPKAIANEELSKVLDKALRNVREGSRLAIDQVIIQNGGNREDYKDQVVDLLLDKGYKVVAKEYLEKLYEEQQQQQSGIYNERTTVQENNFSAVGYYINVKVAETSLRVQVVNVSTGEYEGNATVNF